MTIPFEDQRCTFTYADGRRCRMLRMEGHDSLCPHHWSREEELDTAARAWQDLAGGTLGLNTARGLNNSLIHLYTMVAQGRIPPRRAMAQAYVGQLILQSLPYVQRENEEWAEIAKDLLAPVRDAVAGIQSRAKSGQATGEESAALLEFQSLVLSGLVKGVTGPEVPGADAEGDAAAQHPDVLPQDVEAAARRLLKIFSAARQEEPPASEPAAE